MRVRHSCYRGVGCALALIFGASMPVLASVPATIQAGEQIIHKGESAQFAITSSAAASSELQAWCDVTAAGRASLTFDGEHYVPLSEPAVGDIITLAPGETRHYDLDGSVEANKGDAYIAFVFTDIPAAMCFPGQQCGGATVGAQDVKVKCGHN